MFTALLAALAGIGGYIWGKNKKKDKNNSSTTTTTTETTDTETENPVKNIYNYNYLNDSTTGNTLFSSKKKTNRAIFGTQS